ncbi:hypothetical protein CYY_007487 [Polysphondylium violaceum]|uniref:MYND-type domain-containing protein n=1 Tax=Polysphondylium violaceum TaxID=133409 RepID=A0A8J4PX73_9MYCE|nr:hypothetical protein CYY_007487 [Polysphondylium violaceum]
MNEGNEAPYCIVCNSSNVSVCTGCNKVYYCGTEHQNLHWPVHRRDCAAGKHSHSHGHGHNHGHSHSLPTQEVSSSGGGNSGGGSPSSFRKKSHDSLAVTGSTGNNSPSARNSPPPGGIPFDSSRKSVAVSNIKQLQQQIQSLQQPQTGSGGLNNSNSSSGFSKDSNSSSNNSSSSSSSSITPSMVKKSAGSIRPSYTSNEPQSKVIFKPPSQQSQQQPPSPQPIMPITNSNSGGSGGVSSIKAKQQKIQESLMKSNSSGNVSTTTTGGSKIMSPSPSTSSISSPSSSFSPSTTTTSSSSLSNTNTPITSPETINNNAGPPQYTPPQPTSYANAKQAFIAPSPKSNTTPPAPKPRTSPPSSGYIPRTNTPPPSSFESPTSNTSSPSSLNNNNNNNNNNEDINNNSNQIMTEDDSSIKSLKNKLNQLNFNVGGPPPGAGYRKSVLSQSSSAVPLNTNSNSSPIQSTTLIPNPMTPSPPPTTTFFTVAGTETTTTTTNQPLSSSTSSSSVSFSNNIPLPTSNSSGNVNDSIINNNSSSSGRFQRDHKKNQSLPEHMVNYYSNGSYNSSNNNNNNNNRQNYTEYENDSDDENNDFDDEHDDNIKYRDRSRPRGLRTNDAAVIEWESGTIEYKGNKPNENRKGFLNHEKNKYQTLDHDDNENNVDAILTTPIDSEKDQLQPQQQQSQQSHHSRIAGKFRDIKKKANIISALTKNKVSEVASKTKKSLSSTNENEPNTNNPTTTSTTTTNNNIVGNENTIIFGLPLDVGIERSSTLHPLMPDIVYKCIEYIKERGMQEEGIFRISGSSSAIQALKNEFNNGVDVDLSQQLDQHVVSGILKLYLRQIPETLFTNEFSEELEALREGGNSVEAVSSRVCGLTSLLKFLPESNRCILHYLCSLLNNISFEPSTKMSNVNLAIVFAPTLGCSVEVMTTLISQYDAIFSEQTYNYQ